MMLVDTNVISELLRSAPDPQVVRWAKAVSSDNLFIPAIVIGELRFGVARLPEGARKTALAQAIDRLTQGAFADRVLSFGGEETSAFAKIKATREVLGRPVGDADAMIAATAIRHGLALATRNIRDFEGLDLRLINPFRSGI